MSTLAVSRSAIVARLFVGGPFQVATFIVAFIIDAIKDMFWARPTPNVGKEISVVEIHRYPSIAIVFPVFVFGIIAAVAGSGPCFPFWSGDVFNIISMASVSLANTIHHEAPARLSAPAFQVVGLDYFFVSAVAETEKACIAMPNVNERKNDQATKALTGKVDGCSHNGILTVGDTVVH